MHWWDEVAIGIGIVLGSTFLIFMCRRVSKAFKDIAYIKTEVVAMRTEGSKRKKETIITFRAFRAIFDALRKGKMNGSAELAESQIEDYLTTEAVE